MPITTYTAPDGDILRFEGGDPRVLRTPGCCCVIAATEFGVTITPVQARDLARRLLAAAGGPHPPRMELRPCGTRAAYVRHIRHREAPCDACKAANAARSRAMRAANRARHHRLRTEG